jgi:hypothetical protein
MRYASQVAVVTREGVGITSLGESVIIDHIRYPVTSIEVWNEEYEDGIRVYIAIYSDKRLLKEIIDCPVEISYLVE